ncbi:uncharacterized protein LOC129050547 [Pongo abelii]|uniref:uncharacterized protein LOC129050547 n=1 Tax=Pongo abelii TaxID=9601 RepID=UPI0030072BF2
MPRVVALTPTGAVQGSSGETSSPGDENGSLCGRLGTEELPVPSLNTRWHEIIGHIWASVSEKLSFKSKCEPFEDADTHSAIQVIGLKLHLHPSFLVGKKVIDVAAGSTHCLALTEDSEVHSWRSNDQCQHFDTLRVTKPEPAALPGLDAKHIVGVTCGPAQDIEAKKEAQKEKEIDEQEANASAFHRSRTPLDKDLINTGICESSGKQCLPLVQLIQQRLSQCERMVSIVLEGPTRRRWEESDSACEQRLTLAEAKTVRQCCLKMIIQEERKNKVICERDLLENETHLYLCLIKICFLSHHAPGFLFLHIEKAEPWQVGSGS